MACNVPKFRGAVGVADPPSLGGVHVLRIAQKHHFSAGNMTKVHRHWVYGMAGNSRSACLALNELRGGFEAEIKLLGFKRHRAGLPLLPWLLQLFPAAFPSPWGPESGTGISCISEPSAPPRWAGVCCTEPGREQRADSACPEQLPTSPVPCRCGSCLCPSCFRPHLGTAPGSPGKGLTWQSLLGWAAGAGGRGSWGALEGRCSWSAGAVEGREGMARGVLLISGCVLCNFSQIPVFSVGSCWNELSFHARTTTKCVYAVFFCIRAGFVQSVSCSDTTHRLFVCVFQVLQFFGHFLSI